MKRVLILKVEEEMGGYDFNALRELLNIAGKQKGFEFILMPNKITPLGVEEIKSLIKDLKAVLK